MLFSICIPSYNRPVELLRLLQSIDMRDSRRVEIIICEDHSPKRLAIRDIVNNFQKNSEYKVRYIENEKNYGYDRNLRELLHYAQGEFVVFMGDDDAFAAGGLDKMADFIEKNKSHDLGYILKTHLLIHDNQGTEVFRYFPESKIFSPGEDACHLLLRRSVFISGFIIRRKYALDYMTEIFDGTLLYQLYLLAEVVMKYPSAYYDQPLTMQYKEGIPLFGSSESEKKLYDPGVISIKNSLNFMSGFFKISEYMDDKYSMHLTQHLRREISKYSYPVLSIQRGHGRTHFRQYTRQLGQLRINGTIYYYIYWLALYIFGVRICDHIIFKVKKIIGYTPQL